MNPILGSRTRTAIEGVNLSTVCRHLALVTGPHTPESLRRSRDARED